MKANEAPEKLYVNFHFMETHPESHQPFVTKQGLNKYDIEYTRTDAFIEKTISYLSSHLYDWVQTLNPNQRSCSNTVTKKDFIEEFRKYMEGE